MFNNVEVDSLRNAINSCSDNIKYSESEEIISDLNGNSVWEADAKYNFLESLETQVNINFSALKNKLADYLEIVNLIEQYQILDEKNKNLELEIVDLRKNLYYTENYQVTSTDSNGEEITITKTREVLDKNVQNSINNYSNKIAENNEKMEILKNHILNGI